MADIIRKRLTGREEGFTLIELLVVIVILGILLAIAVPSYMGFRNRAQQTAAQANVRAAVPAVESYYQDNNTYVGMTRAKLVQSYDAGLKLTSTAIRVSATGYCIQATVGSYTYNKNGPTTNIVSGVCA
ncbi:MAG: prepilin-type N-terminal cleavage/methylation domain-containing protein [Gaiellaceae bacterium]|jgi:type IV pilus assembly protein PilA